MKPKIEDEAVKWLIRNNYQIQLKLEDDQIKEVIIDAFKAGSEVVPVVKRAKVVPFQMVGPREETDQLTSYSKILVQNL